MGTMAKIEITAEQARILYESREDLRGELLKAFTREELGLRPVLREWSEISKAGGYFVRGGNIDHYIGQYARPDHSHTRDVFATKKQAQSAQAMAQLSILMKDLGEECKLNWFNRGEPKYVIFRKIDELVVWTRYTEWQFLAFRTAEVRNQFLNTHRRLIEQYFMLGDD